MMAWGASFYRRRIISEGIERRAHGRSPLDASTFFFGRYSTLRCGIRSFSLDTRKVRLSQLSAYWGMRKLLVITEEEI